MTNIIIGFAIAAASLSACNNNNAADTKKTELKNDTTVTVAQQKAQDTTIASTAVAFPVKEIIAGYLQLKNAFTKDNSSSAAEAAALLQVAFKNFDNKNLTAGQNETFGDIAGDVNEHAEHIRTNSGKIAHQREHFIMLSKDIVDFVKTFGSGGQTLYKDFCPMANDGKGAIWISEIKEIKNPYQGSKMLTCGSVKETLK